ncbi:hypothetical protein [Micromonospora sp. NPDC048839]
MPDLVERWQLRGSAGNFGTHVARSAGQWPESLMLTRAQPRGIEEITHV